VLSPLNRRPARVAERSLKDCLPTLFRLSRTAAVGQERTFRPDRSPAPHPADSISLASKKALHSAEQVHAISLEQDRVCPFADLDVLLLGRID
jgi:hypothetical protein